MLARCIAAIGLLLFAGCTHDPLVVRNVYPGLVPVRAPQGELTQVLFSAAAAPAQQGLLYVAMFDAAVAGQNANLARGAATPEAIRPGSAKCCTRSTLRPLPSGRPRGAGSWRSGPARAMACAAPART